MAWCSGQHLPAHSQLVALERAASGHDRCPPEVQARAPYGQSGVVYEGVIPAAQHRAISKSARKTNHIERFNNALRQRVSRLVHEAFSFSKKLANHIGAITLFICHYNLTRAAA
jgi:insertion element IS1 protein InsB